MGREWLVSHRRLIWGDCVEKVSLNYQIVISYAIRNDNFTLLQRSIRYDTELKRQVEAHGGLFQHNRGKVECRFTVGPLRGCRQSEMGSTQGRVW